MNAPATNTKVIGADAPNPSIDKSSEGEERVRRIPMSVPTLRLEVAKMDGWHLHWFRESKIPRAQQAGYVLVSPDEIQVNSRPIAGERMTGGNTDLGSCVSIVGSTEGANGPERLVLMKLKEQFWLEDKALLDERNASIYRDIFVGESIGVDKEGRPTGLPDNAYVKTAKSSSPILNRGMPKAKILRGGRST